MKQLTKCPQCGWVHPYHSSRLVNPVPEVLAIIWTVCNVFGIDANEVLSDSRGKHIVEVRHLAITLAKRETRFTLGEIGQQFGRDHTTVIHSIKATEHRVKTDHQFADIVWRNWPDYAKSVQSKAGAA